MMHYLVLGDSISIDDYTEVGGGGRSGSLARDHPHARPVILNTVYDPTDDDSLAACGMTPQARAAFNALNDGIRAHAHRRGSLFSDLETLFHGHGAA